MSITRRISRQIRIGNVRIGGDAPVPIQSMTSTQTSNIKATVKEIKRLENAGCDIVRLGIPDEKSANAIKEIKKEVKMPLVADIHFDYRLAIASINSGVDALRINPGNLRNKEEIKIVAHACKEKNIPIRIGVNSGSIDRKKYSQPDAEALVDSALNHIRLLEDSGFSDIKVSLKSSDVATMVEAYRLFAPKNDYPLHLGVTEAGGYEQAVIKSSAGIGALLLDGIGDTIRFSITGDVVKEVQAAKTLLRALGIRREGIEIISCPTCARKEFNVEKVVEELTFRTKDYKKYMKVAVMGCVVNGPGEAVEADIGVAVGKKEAVLFENGRIIKNISKSKILSALINKIENYQRQ